MITFHDLPANLHKNSEIGTGNVKKLSFFRRKKLAAPAFADAANNVGTVLRGYVFPELLHSLLTVDDVDALHLTI